LILDLHVRHRERHGDGHHAVFLGAEQRANHKNS
jgi:hypothetical protein